MYCETKGFFYSFFFILCSSAGITTKEHFYFSVNWCFDWPRGKPSRIGNAEKGIHECIQISATLPSYPPRHAHVVLSLFPDGLTFFLSQLNTSRQTNRKISTPLQLKWLCQELLQTASRMIGAVNNNNSTFLNKCLVNYNFVCCWRVLNLFYRFYHMYSFRSVCIIHLLLVSSVGH